MAAIITENFRLHNAEQFYESFSEASASAYYLFIGKPTPYSSTTSGGTDSSPPTPADDVTTEFYSWDSMIAAKKIASTDITYAVPRRDWASGTVYDMYEHNISSDNTTTSSASNLYDSKFYFRTSANRVYKVIANNGGAAAGITAEPSNESTSLFTAGTYVLKYMYTISASDQEKYLTTDFMPVSTDSTVSAAATDGAIESLIVTNAGSGMAEGTYYAAVYGDGTNAGGSSGAIVRITVSGDSIASFGTTAGTDTTIHAAGAGYTYGTVNLGAGYTFSDSELSTASNTGGSGATISVVIGPKGGHGSNAINELGGHYVMTRTTLTGAEADDVLAGNDFRNLGIVVDPTTYGTSTVASATTYRQTYALKLTSTSGTFTPDEKITQASTDAIGKVVEWDSSNSILYYQQEKYSDFGTNSTTGAYVAFSGANAVTGASSSATGTPDSSADSAVTLTNGSTITFSDGYANPELASDSGKVIYTENRRPISRATDQTEDIKVIVEF